MTKALKSFEESREVKPCRICKEYLTVDKFGRNRVMRDGLSTECLECARVRRRASYQKHKTSRVNSTLQHRRKNRSHFDNYQKSVRATVKAELVAGYGGKCTCCGESEIDFLTMEHLNKDGRKHRKEKHGSLGTYRDAIAEGFPPKYTVLCLNCNHARRYGKECPHKEPRNGKVEATKMGDLQRDNKILVDALRNAISVIDGEGGTESVDKARALLAALEAERGGGL